MRNKSLSLFVFFSFIWSPNSFQIELHLHYKQYYNIYINIICVNSLGLVLLVKYKFMFLFYLMSTASVLIEQHLHHQQESNPTSILYVLYVNMIFWMPKSCFLAQVNTVWIQRLICSTCTTTTPAASGSSNWDRPAGDSRDTPDLQETFDPWGEPERLWRS